MINVLNPDVVLQRMMGGLIDLVKKRSSIHQNQWKPGQKLKLLFAGYAGARNTGGDVRVEEMIRQIRIILGDENSDLSILTLNPELTQGYFENVKQVTLPQIFPPFLYQECPKHHGVIACEGSMFKSKFADALSTMMAGSLGMANAENKLSVGYGAEAGFMNPPLKHFVQTYCKKSLVICRNKASERLLEEMSIRTASGTDTAWTFRPSSTEKARQILMQKGWDGQMKILALGPIHPFCWPVKPSLRKSFERYFWNRHRESHYKSVYFHHHSLQDEQRYDNYITAIANAVKAFRSSVNVFPVIVGMEKLDRRACEKLANKFDFRPPMFISDEYDMYDMVAILRQAGMLLTSRFHAVVCSMPGLVPSAGITMDERIQNLLTDRDHKDLLLSVGEENLEDKILFVLKKLHQDAEQISHQIGSFVPKQIRLMAEMGMAFENELLAKYPDFRLPKREKTWSHYLPRMDQNLQNLMEKFS